MTEVVVDQCQDQHQDQGPGQVQESVQTETELGVISVGNMAILLVIPPTLSQIGMRPVPFRQPISFTNFGT